MDLKRLTTSTPYAYDPITLLHYIGRNFPSLMISRSRRFKGNKKGAFRYTEKMINQLTFTHIAVLICLYWNIPVPIPIQSETIYKLIELGFLSNKIKIKPFTIWLITLINGYIRKTRLSRNPNQKQNIENLFNWNIFERYLSLISKNSNAVGKTKNG